MMLSRRIPNASPGARGSVKRNPSSSGPRCRIAAVIAFTRDSASVLRVLKATPQIPHTLFFDLRRREEGRARSDYVFPKVEARNPRHAVRIPRKDLPEQQKEDRDHGGEHQVKIRLAFQKQAPVNLSLPAREKGADELSHMQPL